MSRIRRRSRRWSSAVRSVAAGLLAMCAVAVFAGVFAGIATPPTARADVIPLAQDDSEALDPGEERAETFEADTSGAQTENIPGGLLMVAAYAVVWTVLLGYLMSLGVRQAKTARDLERLRQDLAAGPRSTGSDPASAEG